MIVLTGLFRQFSIFFGLLFIHECGHFLTGYFLGWKLDKIYFYPYGGYSKFITKVNQPLWQEFFVLIMGPLFQCLGYFVFLQIFTRTQDLTLLSNYHYGILIFNLLPIYPLDGGKLLSLILSFFQPYLKSLKITFFFSFLVLFFLFFFSIRELYQTNLLFLTILLFSKLLEENKKKDYYYQRFLLERYLEPIPFRRRKIVSNIKEMYRDRKHLFYFNRNYHTESEILNDFFQKKKK